MKRLVSDGKLKKHRGMTLVELLVVVLILGVLAAVMVPRLGNMERSSKLATSISNLNDTTKMLETFKTASKGKMPDGFDSLLDSTGVIYAGNGDPLQNSGVYSGWLTASQLTTGELASLRRVSSNVVSPGGPTNSLITVYDHSTTAASAQTSTDSATARSLDTTGNVAVVNASSSQGTAVYQAFGLSPTDTTFRLLAVGIGPHCTIVGRNNYGAAMAEAPLADDYAPNCDYSYRRPVALYRVSDTSQYFAEFVGTVTSYGKTASQIRAYAGL